MHACQGKPCAPVWSGIVFGWQEFTKFFIHIYVGSSNGRRHLVHARQGKPCAPVWSGFAFGWRAQVAYTYTHIFFRRLAGWGRVLAELCDAIFLRKIGDMSRIGVD